MVDFSQFMVLGLMMGGLYALLGMGIVLVCKATQVVSLVHGQLLFFGAYFVWLFYNGLGLPIWLALPIGIAVTGLMGVIIDRLTMRPLIGQPIASLFLMTLALFMALDGICKLILKGYAKTYTPPFIPVETMHLGQLMIPPSAIWGFGAALVIALLLGLLFRYTKMGLAMRITAEDHLVAQSMGIKVKRVFSSIWFISAMVTCVAGVFLAFNTDIYFTMPEIGFKGLIVALFGGLESLPGALLGGLVLGLLEGLTAGYVEPLVGGGAREVAAYGFLLIILLFRPYGLFGLVRIERV